MLIVGRIRDSSTLAAGQRSEIGSIASAGSAHKSSGDNVVRMWVQLSSHLQFQHMFVCGKSSLEKEFQR